MEFRPEENVDAHSCTCFVTTFDKLLYYGVSQQISIAVHLLSVELSIIFDPFPSVSEQFPISFELHLDELWQFGLRLLPDDRLV